MMGVREEIEGAQRRERVAASGEKRYISSKRDGVASDVDHLSRPQLRDALDDTATGPGSRRIENDRRRRQSGALARRGIDGERRQPPVDPRGLRSGTEPLRQILSRKVGRSGVALDTRDVGSRAKVVGDGRREQAHPSVKVEVGRRGVEQCRVDRLLHGGRERLRSAVVHLPEPVIGEAEFALAHDLGDDGRLLLAHDETHAARGWGEHVDVLMADETLVERSGLREGIRGKWKVRDGDDPVRARGERPHHTLLVNVEPHPRAPSRAGARIVALDRLHSHLRIKVGHAGEGVHEHLALELALVRQFNVTELGPTSPVCRVPSERGSAPHMLLAMRARREHLDRLGPPEGLLGILAHPSTHPLPRNGIGDEHDTTIVTSNRDAAVRDVGNVDVDHLAGPFTHPSSIGVAVRLYLASTSPARLATLRAAGIEPVLLASGVDEDAVAAAAGPLPPDEAVLMLARAKAEAVVGRLVEGAPLDGVIVGGDSLFELDGVVYGKPHHPEVARERWNLMRGRAGLLHSGHWVIDHRDGTARASAGATSTTSVTFASDITDDELDAYIATGEPLQVAGAFTIDGLGSAFITSVSGDPHTVVGISVSLTRQLAVGLGLDWPSLWNRAL